ncbi:MAG: small basic family protein [Armatimonadetes bacterium]|nr:small basic family protein [Armatimonadota bacterium]
MRAVGLIGLLVGLAIGYVLNVPIPAQWAPYISLAALCGMDAAIGGWRASVEGKFVLDVFLTGFLVNALLAMFLAYLGDILGVELLLAAVVTLGGRMFLNLSVIRRFYLNQWALNRRQR